MEQNQGLPVSSLNSPPAAGCHRLPQIPSMGRNVRTAQSKTSAKLNIEPKFRDEAAVLHVEGTSKVVKILTDGISELTEFDNKDNIRCQPSSAGGENTLVQETEISTDLKDNPANDLPSVTSSNEMQTVTSKKRKPKRSSTNNKTKQMSSKQSKLIDNTNVDKTPSYNIPVTDSCDIGITDVRTNNQVVSDTSMMPESGSLPDHIQGFETNHEQIAEGTACNKKESPLEKKKRASKTMGTSAVRNFAQMEVSQPAFEGENVEVSKIAEDKSENIPAGEVLDQMETGDVPATGHIPRCVLILPAEVPSEAQLEKLLASDSTTYDLQCPPQWQEGDLLWAKVSGHPYWPCMVARCPFSKMFTKIQGDVRIMRAYHVQFFGNEVERGWINEPSLMVFEGKLKFLDRAQVELAKGKKGKGGYNPFKINISRRHAWNIAVDEAEGALPLSKENKILEYAFEYIFMDELKREQQKLNKERESQDFLESTGTTKPVAGVKRKRAPSDGSGLSPPQNRRKKQKLDISSPTEVAAGVTYVTAETSFDAYYAKNRSTVIEQHPEWDTPLVFEYLRQQWESEKKKTPRSRGKRLSLKNQVKGSSLTQASRSPQPVKQAVEESTRDSRPQSKLAKLLSGESSILDFQSADNKRQGRGNLPRKRGRRPKSMLSPEIESGASPCPSASDSVEDMPVLEEDTARPKLAGSALSARKASHESDSSTEGKGKGLRENEPYELEIFKLNSTCKIERDKVCAVCEKNGEVIDCTGPCGQHFHTSCITNVESQPVPEQFMCHECTSGIHSCFACKTADMETVKCSVNVCGKYYHEDCIRKYRLSRVENKGFVCPLHTCATCAVDNVKNPKASKGRFFRCVRCPTAYHVGDFCIAAGSVNLAGSHIVCSDHFQPNRSLTHHSRLNITWCFSCSKGGTLLCCESCPAAFHAECVKVDKTPEEAWFCVDCSEGKKPLYGNIVWIKVGNYRWWPGEICHPRHVPLNIQEKAHQVGEFPVRFFGSHDYYWIHRGRVFLFQEGDKGSREGSSRGLFKIYMKGVKEATEAFKLWTAAKAKKVEQEQERNEKKPAPYKFIKSNVPIGSVQIYKAELSEIPRCECKPDQEAPCTTDCLNRMMMYECHPTVCPAGEKCHNQRFQKRQYPECEPFKSESRGWGLRCLEDIKKGQFVLEYVGDLIDEEECKRRIEQAHEDNITNFYMLTMDKNRIIDAGPKGNFSRFMNHSCCPNLETQKWTVNGDIRVGLFALCDITKGSELTFNYNLECLGNEKKACACGAENCSGFLGVRPKTAAAAANEKKAKEPKKKRRKKKLDPRKEHEDDCFRCGEGGELVMCDKGNCPKVYHLQCLKLTKPPSGKWLCPWHHCDVCGKLAVRKCSECPNSYCAAHTEGNISDVERTLVCREHTDLLEGISQSLGSCSSDGTNGIKSEVESSTSDNDTAASPSVPDDGETDTSFLPIVHDQSVDADTKQNGFDINSPDIAKPSGESKARVKRKTARKTKAKELDNNSKSASAPVKKTTVMSDHSSSSQPETNCVTDATDMSQVKPAEDGPSQKPKSRRKAEASSCRTKARYKARLTPASMKGQASSVIKSSSNVQHSPAAHPLSHDSDDNDSISNLVIDIP